MNASKVEIMDWPKYVARIAGDDTQAAIGHKIGVSGATISRWSTFAPKPENVAAFARAYKRPVLEAFVAAGFLTAEEAKERPVGKPQASDLDSRELLAEVERRMGIAPVRDQDDPAHYDLAAHPNMEIAADRLDSEFDQLGEENQDPDH